MRNIAAQARDRLDSDLSERFRVVNTTAGFIEATDLKSTDIQSTINLFHSTFLDYSWVAFVSAEGIVLNSNQDLLKGVSVAERPWFKPSLQAPYLGDVHQAKLLQRLLNNDSAEPLRFLDLAAPVLRRDGTLAGVFAVHLNWHWAKNILAPFESQDNIGAGYTLLILDKQGLVLHGPTELLGKPVPHAGSLTEGALWEDQQGTLSVVTKSNTIAPNVALDWFVVVQAQKSDIFSLVGTVRLTILLASLAVMSVALLIATFLARRLTSPIEQLEYAISTGTEPPPCEQFHESASLSRAFKELLARVSSEKDAIETLVQERTAELQDLLRAVDAHSIISMTDIDGNITFCNDQFCEVSGYTREELIGRNHRLIRSKIHPPEVYQDLWSTITRGEIWQGVLCNRNKAGHTYWVQSTICPTRQAGSGKARYISIRTDITAMMEVQRQLEIFRRIIETTDEAISIMDGEGKYLYGNPARERLTGIPQDELCTMQMAQSLAITAQPLYEEIMDAVNSGQSWQGHLPLKRSNGETFVTASNIGVISDENGKPLFIFNVFHDHTREIERTLELEEARNHAIEANRAKSTFLSNMSHELRTPLNAILGFAQLMMSNPQQPITPMQNKQLGYILKGGEHLLELINEVLDLAKIEAGKMTLSVEALSLGTVIQEALMLADKVLSANNITVECQDPQTMPVIHADMVRAKQVILNLISNAAKYNRPNGSIFITGQDQGDGYRLCIRDTGYGIPPQKMDQLFKPFSRLGAETSEIEGTGIGLALSKTLMELMEGKIGVDSTPDEGTSFWLDFRYAQPSELQAPPETHDTVSLGQHPLPTGRVLYVEDNPANIALMEQIFTLFPQLSLSIAQSAEDGLALIPTVQPSVILMDLNLPGMGGIEALGVLRRRPDTQFTPVIALTADATKETRHRAVEAGFNNFLVKPVNLGELIQSLHTALSSSDGAS